MTESSRAHRWLRIPANEKEESWRQVLTWFHSSKPPNEIYSMHWRFAADREILSVQTKMSTFSEMLLVQLTFVRATIRRQKYRFFVLHLGKTIVLIFQANLPLIIARKQSPFIDDCSSWTNDFRNRRKQLCPCWTFYQERAKVEWFSPSLKCMKVLRLKWVLRSLDIPVIEACMILASIFEVSLFSLYEWIVSFAAFLRDAMHTFPFHGRITT